MQNQPLELIELRMRADYLTEQLILGLRNRSKFSLNLQTFSEIFHDNKTWFMYRLKKEQDLDAEFGRYLYNPQDPFVFKKAELSKPLLKETITDAGFGGVAIDHSKEIIDLYKKMLYEICSNDDNRSTYGETTKIDVDNVLLLNERLVSYGQQVAWTKINTVSHLAKETDPEKIKEILVSKDREVEVIKHASLIAQKHGLTNVESVKDFVRVLIDFTTQIEVETVLVIGKKN